MLDDWTWDHVTSNKNHNKQMLVYPFVYKTWTWEKAIQDL